MSFNDQELLCDFKTNAGMKEEEFKQLRTTK